MDVPPPRGPAAGRPRIALAVRCRVALAARSRVTLAARSRVALAARCGAAIAVAVLSARGLLALETGVEPLSAVPSAALAAVQPAALATTTSAARPFFIDKRLGPEVRLALEEARRKLDKSQCAGIVTDYADDAGMRLDQNLQATGESLSSYLGFVLFYDGQATSPCARSEVLAWTEPGSRAVHVCGVQFQAVQRLHPGYAAATVIHETLHTLGLTENPPDPREITARVIQRCGP